MKNLKLITVTALILTVFLFAHERTTNFAGKIEDTNGAAIVLGTFEVYTTGMNPELVYRGITGTNGNFNLNGLRPDRYKIKIFADGFDNKITYVDLTKNSNYQIFKLEGNVITLPMAEIFGKSS